MKCWVCKKKINYATEVPYTDGTKEKTRVVCEQCYPSLKFDACGFVEVKRV